MNLNYKQYKQRKETHLWERNLWKNELLKGTKLVCSVCRKEIASLEKHIFFHDECYIKDLKEARIRFRDLLKSQINVEKSDIVLTRARVSYNKKNKSSTVNQKRWVITHRKRLLWLQLNLLISYLTLGSITRTPYYRYGNFKVII